jgi:hypothetical protein
MELIVEVPHPSREPATSLGLPGAGETTRVTDVAGSLDRPWTRPYSFLADCECPDACLRDHANE